MNATDSPAREEEAVEAYAIGQPEELPQRPVDPVRYGDWEVNGRCIDF